MGLLTTLWFRVNIIRTSEISGAVFVLRLVFGHIRILVEVHLRSDHFVD